MRKPRPSMLASVSAYSLLTLSCTGMAGEVLVTGDSEQLAFERPESWAMAYMSAATLFLGGGPPTRSEPWSFHLGADLASIPRVTREDSRVGFDGLKYEDLNKSPAYGRIRGWLTLPNDAALEVAWTPPVSVNGAKPDGIYSIALEQTLFEIGRWRGGARLYGQSGHVTADITCPADVAVLPPGSINNPFGCIAPSRDDVRLEHLGLEVTAAFTVDNSPVQPFASIAITRVEVDVQINAQLQGSIDRSERSTDGTIRTLRLGLLHRSKSPWQWLVSFDYTPLEVRRPPGRNKENDPFWSLRVMGRYSF
ncbi:MAG: hypothetical protein KC477_13905 [Oceanospirillaceae bacterium]|nr:hypothetical protein [Oceanospirillaceae bacterium]